MRHSDVTAVFLLHRLTCDKEWSDIPLTSCSLDCCTSQGGQNIQDWTLWDRQGLIISRTWMWQG